MSTMTIAPELMQAIDVACARIAPSWPLDRMIAVNPYWGFVQQPIEHASAAIGALMGSRMLMPHEWYLEQTRTLPTTSASHTTPRRALMTDVVDATRDLSHNASWNDFVVQHISRSCAACFDEGQAQWRPSVDDGLYALWQQLSREDAGPRRMMGLHRFRDTVAALPSQSDELIALALRELGVPTAQWADYCSSLLLSVNGWAAACAFTRWEARLNGTDDASLVDLLAIRLAWELLLFRLWEHPERDRRWHRAMDEWPQIELRLRAEQATDWQRQREREASYQRAMVQQLRTARSLNTATNVSAQAVFCIDVRSEVFRRALESVAPDVRTLGFAGFFGAPIAYESMAHATRAQLPGLLAPSLVVRDGGVDASVRAKALHTQLDDARSVRGLGQLATSAFSYVESTGLAAFVDLARRTVGRGGGDGDVFRGGLDAAANTSIKPAIASRANGEPFTQDDAVALAAGVLTGMSLTHDFAPLVALIGHGAATCNNPQAAGLACGACGGQSGEVNARVIAALLNAPPVRAGLRDRGIMLTDATHVVAGLHDTTTDEVQLFDLDAVPATHTDAVEAFAASLRDAGHACRVERAPALGVTTTDRAALLAALRSRTADWSEVRAEWGLARNAAFIVAPRERTAGINLGGRAFLHEYRADRDPNGAVLEAIMTAPMLVTHWINMQYYASTVDNARFGSGDKVLHNVAGANQGVFEGASGDLRIGLALQSVHDGRDWYHEPLRLSVFLEAPAEQIDRVIASHEVVRDLVVNEWLYLFRIDPETGEVHQRGRDGWM